MRDAIRHKLAYVTEDRKGNGLILSSAIKTNTTLANMEAVSRHTVIDKDKEYMVAEEYRDKLKTKCPSVEQNVGNLSGGNQQKGLIGRWLCSTQSVLILDEPTRGVDVKTKSAIYALIDQLAASGMSIIMVSSELPEIINMSDRVLVMCNGYSTGILNRDELTQERIMTLATTEIGA